MTRVGAIVIASAQLLSWPLNAAAQTSAKDVSQVVTTQPLQRAAKTSVAATSNVPATPPDLSARISAAGRRDPFVSPVASHSMVASGCNSGKRCLSVDQVNLKGIVRSDTGMIAVVVNAAGKTYFLRENDSVLRGFVKSITGTSVVFTETVRDKLGKPLTRDVVRNLSAAPAS